MLQCADVLILMQWCASVVILMLRCADVAILMLRCAGMEILMLRCAGMEILMLRCAGMEILMLRCAGMEILMLRCAGMEILMLRCAGMVILMLRCAGMVILSLRCAGVLILMLQFGSWRLRPLAAGRWPSPLGGDCLRDPQDFRSLRTASDSNRIQGGLRPVRRQGSLCGLSRRHCRCLDVGFDRTGCHARRRLLPRLLGLLPRCCGGIVRGLSCWRWRCGTAGIAACLIGCRASHRLSAVRSWLCRWLRAARYLAGGAGHRGHVCHDLLQGRRQRLCGVLPRRSRSARPWRDDIACLRCSAAASRCLRHQWLLAATSSATGGTRRLRRSCRERRRLCIGLRWRAAAASIA